MSDCVRYPAPGCVVEYMEGNAVQIALITEEAGGRLRLLLPNRRETRLNASRLLPWLGPLHGADLGRDEAVRLLEQHKKCREDLASDVPVMDVWELAQGEVNVAPATWFAELFTSDPSADQVSAYGRALLACKSHFRFQPPDFQVFPADMVEKRLVEEKTRLEREALIAGGAAFLRMLWDVACRKRELPPPPAEGASSGEWPSADVAESLEEVLRSRMVDPEGQEFDALWRTLGKGLPDVPHLPLQLLVAWGKVPPHYNFWLDRAGFAPGDDWWTAYRDEVDALVHAAESGQMPDAALFTPAAPTPCMCDDAAASIPAAAPAISLLFEPGPLPESPLPFVSIDSASTRDVDDAFHVQSTDDGYLLTLALACPALYWRFGGALDRAVLHRGTSIYLPEGDCHMLPEVLGTAAYSLLAGTPRPALCVEIPVDAHGRYGSCRTYLARVRLAANLTYRDSQAVLNAQSEGVALPDNPAAAHAGQLSVGLELARKRQNARIEDGAVVMDRPDPVISLEGEGADVRVHVGPDYCAPDAQMLVAEMMIVASAAVAHWARERGMAMLHRVQDVVLPREYAGVWSTPQDMTRIMRALTPSGLEVQARPHAALGLDRYTPVTSPLRRYPDLVNEAQVVHFLCTGQPRWSEDALVSLLHALSPALDGAGQVQRFRPRYWKLLFFRQQGDKVWWSGVITEENDAFVSVSLPDQGMFVRGRRKLFDDRAHPGLQVDVRIGKVHPLYNEIMILEAATTG
ncbi:MAG: ribonuclease catalytic domain-containing protein [Desulfovibrio sp.]|uniref:ribonuclease catalytic domain-containing protein n=1 Tax=Desulfovibrio sp. TaxID=885 RepID=UPI002A366740|nr:ribonuclease catalytic domain-containing protein [Desulfovibrio sp.]MDY0260331.1 ribonuclease catalytic domain-containing protein [Desulfovibrio sp.]